MHNVGEENELWHDVSEHLLRELLVTKTIETPVNVIVHTLQDVNDQLARVRPFLIDIIRDGIMLYEKEGHPFVAPKPLTADEIRLEAQRIFEQLFPDASYNQKIAEQPFRIASLDTPRSISTKPPNASTIASCWYSPSTARNPIG